MKRPPRNNEEAGAGSWHRLRAFRWLGVFILVLQRKRGDEAETAAGGVGFGGCAGHATVVIVGALAHGEGNQAVGADDAASGFHRITDMVLLSRRSPLLCTFAHSFCGGCSACSAVAGMI